MRVFSCKKAFNNTDLDTCSAAWAALFAVVNVLGVGMNFSPSPRTSLAAIGIDLFVVRLWKAKLFALWK